MRITMSDVVEIQHPSVEVPQKRRTVAIVLALGALAALFLAGYLPRHFAQAAANPVAHDGIADLAAHGETDPHGRPAEIGRGRGRLEHKTGHGTAPSGLDP